MNEQKLRTPIVGDAIVAETGGEIVRGLVTGTWTEPEGDGFMRWYDVEPFGGGAPWAIRHDELTSVTRG